MCVWVKSKQKRLVYFLCLLEEFKRFQEPKHLRELSKLKEFRHQKPLNVHWSQQDVNSAGEFVSVVIYDGF